MKPSSVDRQAEDRWRSWRRPGSSRPRGRRAGPGRRPPRGPRGGERGRVVDRRQARVARADERGPRSGRRAGRSPRRGRGAPSKIASGSWSGDQPAADLGVGVGGDDRLGALALEAAPDAVDVEGRPGAAALERRVARLAGQRRRRPSRPCRPPRRRAARRTRLAPRRVERRRRRRRSRAPDPPVRALQRGDDRRQHVGRVADWRRRSRPSGGPGSGPVTSIWAYIMPAQARRDGRQVALEEAVVADDGEVGGQALAVGRQPVVEVLRARLLLALEDDAEVDRQPPRGRRARPPRRRSACATWLLSSAAPRA